MSNIFFNLVVGSLSIKKPVFFAFMAKNKLEISYEIDFELVAVNASVKEYKLAWMLNKSLGWDLAKMKNIELDFTGNKALSISNYLYKTEYQTFRLIRNRAEDGEEQFNAFIIPELKNFDYFIMLENESVGFDLNAFISKIKEIPFVQFAVLMDTAALKSKDNLIF
ncbi:IPExxxVDY family protein [uncultured Roseivirga sp.]|uniref:IPExxxVDY family protein n=1 Tax=uncultured Roseivirga sp. TaxID=543088 RepID=UPI0030DABE53|tara:strand:- start:2628 stop:3125 length:498 start_codon:yes stop_codon:yes gene_type:complete